MKKNYPLLGRAALLCTALIWGTSFVIMKSAFESVSPMWVLSIRFTLASVLLLMAARKNLKTVSRRCVKGSVLMGVSLAAAYIVQSHGLFYTTPGKNAFLTATYCVLTPFLAWAVYKRKPEITHIAAAFFCIAGIGFVSLNEGFSDVNIGDILTLICGIFYAVQIILMEHYSDSGEATTISAIQFLTAALICWAGALLFEDAPHNVPIGAWMEIGYLGVMCTAVCFYLQAWGMQYTPSSTAAMIMTLEAVFGALTSILFFHEQISAQVAIGFVLIFIAVIISELVPYKGRKLI